MDAGTQLLFFDAPTVKISGYKRVFRTALLAVTKLGATSPVSDFFKWECDSTGVTDLNQNTDLSLVGSAGVVSLATNTLSELPLAERLFLETNGVSIAPVVTTSLLTNGLVGFPYSQSLQATNGAKPYTWSVVTNGLPPGLNLSTNGVVSGTPTSVTNVSFTVQVSGTNGLSSTKTFDLVVSLARPALGIAWTNGLPNIRLTGYVGSNYIFQMSSNLINWVPIATNVVPVGGHISITDPASTSNPRRFYRAVMP